MESVENAKPDRSLVWPGTRSLASNGYMLVYVGKDHPLADVRGYAYEHRWIMSQILGRTLRRGEIVHHVNGKRDDNRPENLVLEGSIAEHKAEHRAPGSNLQKPGEPNPMIECACGCGGHLLKYDNSGRPRRHIKGHSWRKGKRGFDPSETIFCECGCKEAFLRFDSSGRVRRFIKGHHGRYLSMLANKYENISVRSDVMKALYRPGSRAGEYAHLACNLYRGCSHQCQYPCYVPGMLRIPQKKWAALVPTPRPGILDALKKDAKKYANTQDRVLLCFTSDPYCPEAAASGVTRQALEILREHNISFQVLTKGGMRAVDDFDLYGKHDAFATTLTTGGSEAWTWEPDAPGPADRIQAISTAHAMGISTWVSLEPVMDPECSLHVIKMTHHIVDLFKIGKLNHDKALEAKIDWGRFGWEAVALCDKYGVDYYVKDDLRKHMMDVGQAALRNTDTRTIIRK